MLFFIRLLNQCEGTYLLFVAAYLITDAEDPHDLTLEEILIFFTGSSRAPPLGFNPTPSIIFNSDKLYPNAATCALALILPTI